MKKRPTIDVNITRWTSWTRRIASASLRAIDVAARTWVKAPAGGGKTTFLLSIAKAHPAKTFLLVTFSEAYSRRQTYVPGAKTSRT